MVTISDIMKFPSMQGAKVLAGHGGLQNAVNSISVLEYSDPTDVQGDLLDNIEFQGGEVVITSFAHIPYAPELQCANMRRLASVGEVALVLYYVGILMPGVDDSLLKLADELDLPLILMPVGKKNLRYSELISEVMAAVVEDQRSQSNLVSDVLDQVSRRPVQQRTVDTALRMISSRLRTSLILTNFKGVSVGQAMWPMSLELPVDIVSDYTAAPAQTMLHADGKYVTRYVLDRRTNQPQNLWFIREGGPLSREQMQQAAEAMRLAVGIWGGDNEAANMAELVRAILRDEPMKMRRLADIFGVDIASVHAMWVLRCEDEQRERFLQEGCACLRDTLRRYCNTVVVEQYEGYVVAFPDWPPTAPDAEQLGQDVLSQLQKLGLTAILVRCQQLMTTADVRSAFLLLHAHLDDAKRIWNSNSFTLQDLEFVAQCREVVEQGEAALNKALLPLHLLQQEREGAELVHTVCVYFLDADTSVTRCAQLLYMHKNTIKYRLGRIRSILGHDLGSVHAQFALHRAAALHRMLQ